MKMAFLVYLIWNGMVFALYGLDKAKAKQGRWRIRESILILFAFIGGSLGAAAGMVAFRHKTSHMKFRILIPLAVLLSIIIAALPFFAGALPR